MADAADIVAAITRVAKMAGLAVGSDLKTKILPRLLHAAEGQLGLLMEMSVEAALCALAPLVIVEDEEVRLPPRDRLTMADFAKMYEDRTDNADFANVFIAPRDWHKIDPTLVGVHLPSQLEAKNVGAVVKKRGASDPAARPAFPWAEANP